MEKILGLIAGMITAITRLADAITQLAIAMNPAGGSGGVTSAPIVVGHSHVIPAGAPVVSGKETPVVPAAESVEGTQTNSTPPAAEQPAPGVNVPVDREKVKAELRLRYVSFKDSARTETLVRMLEEARAKHAVEDSKRAESQRDPFAEPTPPPPTTTVIGEPAQAPPKQAAPDPFATTTAPPAVTYNREEVKSKLMEVVQFVPKGTDAAVSIMRTIGGVAVLSDLPEAKFAEVVAACDQAVANAKKGV